LTFQPERGNLVKRLCILLILVMFAGTGCDNLTSGPLPTINPDDIQVNITVLPEDDAVQESVNATLTRIVGGTVTAQWMTTTFTPSMTYTPTVTHTPSITSTTTATLTKTLTPFPTNTPRPSNTPSRLVTYDAEVFPKRLSDETVPFTVTGWGFLPNQPFAIRWEGQDLTAGQTSPTGSINVELEVPPAMSQGPRLLEVCVLCDKKDSRQTVYLVLVLESRRPTDTPTVPPSDTPPPTMTYTSTATLTPSSTYTPAYTDTPTHTLTPTYTHTPLFTDTPTDTHTPTSTPTATPTHTPAFTATSVNPFATNTPTPE
jgi:hypothetical protein